MNQSKEKLMRIIETEGMPRSNGHYSQCIEHNGILYLSGQLPIDTGTNNIPESIEDQAKIALNNLERVLVEANSSLNDVIQVRVYITDIRLWDTVDSVYSKIFGDHKPTRCIVPTRELHYGCMIEIEATAVSNY